MASSTRPQRDTALKAALGLGAGFVMQACCYYFWAHVGASALSPWLHGFGRTPDQLAGFLLPLGGAFVAASYHRKGWWWLGPVMAMPAFAGMHLLFAAGVEMAFARPPSLTEEGRFLLAEGHRLVAGLVGAYAGALLQGE
jgi:hypothetical protein